MHDLPEAKISNRVVGRSRLLHSVKHQRFKTANRANTLPSKNAIARCRTEDDSGNPTKRDETRFVRSQTDTSPIHNQLAVFLLHLTTP